MNAANICHHSNNTHIHNVAPENQKEVSYRNNTLLYVLCCNTSNYKRKLYKNLQNKSINSGKGWDCNLFAALAGMLMCTKAEMQHYSHYGCRLTVNFTRQEAVVDSQTDWLLQHMRKYRSEHWVRYQTQNHSWETPSSYSSLSLLHSLTAAAPVLHVCEVTSVKSDNEKHERDSVQIKTTAPDA